MTYQSFKPFEIETRHQDIAMKQLSLLIIIVLLSLFASACHGDDILGTFAVIQSQGLDLNEGDEVQVRITVDPNAEGIEGRGMAGTPEIRYAGATTSVAITAGGEQFEFTQPLDVIVAPLQYQWTTAWVDMESGLAPATESEQPVLQAITMLFRYEPDVLPLDSPVPPDGALTAGQSSTPRFGLDLMVRGHYGDRRDGWSIMGKFLSMGSGN